jgi:hypothetical protein
MTVRYHSQRAQSAYHDLLHLLKDEAVSDIVGTPTRRERGGRVYWYDRYRIGDAIRERYIGEDSEGLRVRLARHRQLKANRVGRSRTRATLVRLLRSEGVNGLDASTGKLLAALAKAGLFRLGGELVGTQAFRLYEGELGIRLPADETAMTADIDVASFTRLSMALGDTAEPSLAQVLHDFDFQGVPSLEGHKVWKWRQTSGETYVEFLTASFEEREGLVDLPALRLQAQALHHLNYLIAEPIEAAAAYRDGILIHIPRPERFAVHKLIVADRRQGAERQKARKDLLQAELLCRVLAEDRPFDLVEAYEDAMSRGPRWRERIDASLKRAPQIADTIARARAG